MTDLFSSDSPISPTGPLAERMRPRRLIELVGQQHLVGPGKILSRLVEEKALTSMILWGPPGTGKTTIARLLVSSAEAEFLEFSAVTSGIKEVRSAIALARENQKYARRKTVLFVDEIHRFNKAQQDAFLPHVENGLITLIGATTENPSFEVIAPLLSRVRVLVLNPLSPEDLALLIDQSLSDLERGLGTSRVELTPEARYLLTHAADGDARALLNGLELAVTLTKPQGNKRVVELVAVEEALQKRSLRYDKGGEEHYNLISALHKSLRDSDPDAALYWLARMLEAGEDPVYILRRMIRFASEDIGTADPLAILLSVSTLEAYRLLGSPEGDLALAHAAVHLAVAEKSNAVYRAFEQARADACEYGSLPVPLHLRNAPTPLMKHLEYGKNYQYAHDFDDALVQQEHLPEELRTHRYYYPTDRGREQAIAERLADRRRRLKKQTG